MQRARPGSVRAVAQERTQGRHLGPEEGATSTAEVSRALGTGQRPAVGAACVPSAPSTCRTPAPSCLGPPKEPGEAKVELAPGVDTAQLQGHAQSLGLRAVLGGSAPLLLLHGLGLGHFQAALSSDAPHQRDKARCVSTWRFVSCTSKRMVGEVVEAGDSRQVQGLSAVFNYPHPSSPWRMENWVYLPPPHCCCWH